MRRALVLALVLAPALSACSPAPHRAVTVAAKPVAVTPKPPAPKPPAPKPPTPKPASVAAPAPAPSAFQREQAMTNAQLMKRWNPLVTAAAKRFGVPQSWIHAVMLAESGGRTMLGENRPIVSDAGAMGLMQLMPSTYEDMRAQYGLGRDPFDPHDNVFAGAAYLRFLRGKYGYPTMFAAYNDGPGNLEEKLKTGGLLPAETRLYLVDVTASVEGLKGAERGTVELTRPDGTPIRVDCTLVTRVRAPLADEYAPSVMAVVTIGKVRQGVREDVAKVTALVRAHGGSI